MKIKYVYDIVNTVISILDNVDLVSIDKRRESQKAINKVYNILDYFRDELIRENIKNKQKLKDTKFKLGGTE